MCDEFIIYPGNLLNTIIQGKTIDQDTGNTTPIDMSVYTTIKIHFKKTRSATTPVLSLSTESGGGLTIDEDQIIINKIIPADTVAVGDVVYDIECITGSNKTTYGPGKARIIKKITS